MAVRAASLQGGDSRTTLDDSLQGSLGGYEFNEDSRASTVASKEHSPCSRTSKKRAPADFSFLTRLDKVAAAPQKARRIATPVSPSAAVASTALGSHLKVCGPEAVQTLRGRMFGREVAFILCGEAHEDTIDLTRRKGDMEPKMGWILVPPSPDHSGYNPDEMIATQSDLTLREAKEWAEDIVTDEDNKDKRTAGIKLVFASLGRTKGSAAVFPPHAQRSSQFHLPGSVVYEWADTDSQAREFNRRRLVGTVPVQEQDALISKRKAERLEEGFELFDDWLIRQFESTSLHVEFIQEAPVSAEEVELHVEQEVSPAPPAHECLRLIDLDSDEDNDDDQPHLGNGCYLDYLRRQTTTYLPQKIVHGVDPRVLGDAEDENLPEFLRGSFQEPRFQATMPNDSDQQELDDTQADWARLDQIMDVQPSVLPSFEAWLGGAADLLYHAPHVKADYSPFLASCVGSPDALWRFFEALYFETVDDALGKLRLDQHTRPLACVRSCAYRPENGKPLKRRPLGRCSDNRRPIPVRTLPLDRYLKARGFDTPRTWISGLAEQLRRAGADHFVNAAKAFYRSAVDHMLADPKDGDIQGDNFVAWLRACHRELHRDIDKSDPSKLLRKEWVKSMKNPASIDHEYFLKSIGIPGFKKAFAQIVAGRRWECTQCGEANRAERQRCLNCDGVGPTLASGAAASGPVHRPSSVEQRMMSKIIVDAFALRSVDLAMILKMASIVNTAPPDAPTVVVLYAGADHTNSVAKFWRSWGFSHAGLPKKGKIAKVSDADSNCLSYPSYLHDFEKLFPVPADVKDVALKMAQSEARDVLKQEREARRTK
jgi:hypothetical protein